MALRGLRAAPRRPLAGRSRARVTVRAGASPRAPQRASRSAAEVLEAVGTSLSFDTEQATVLRRVAEGLPSPRADLALPRRRSARLLGVTSVLEARCICHRFCVAVASPHDRSPALQKAKKRGRGAVLSQRSRAERTALAAAAGAAACAFGATYLLGGLDPASRRLAGAAAASPAACTVTADAAAAARSPLFPPASGRRGRASAEARPAPAAAAAAAARAFSEMSAAAAMEGVALLATGFPAAAVSGSGVVEMDITSPGQSLESFSASGAAAWLDEHAVRFGFQSAGETGSRWRFAAVSPAATRGGSGGYRQAANKGVRQPAAPGRTLLMNA